MEYRYPKAFHQAKTFRRTWSWLMCATCGLLLCLVSVNWAQSTAFTYQGKLTDAGNPANGNFDLQFKLFDTVTVGAGTQQGATLVRNPAAVSAGVFTVTLDFGANVFSGADRFLEIGVRPAGSVSAYTILAPRQALTASPYAIQTLNAQQLGGLPANRYLSTNANGSVGIGTSTPTAKLTLNGTGAFNAPNAARFDLFNTSAGTGFLQHVNDAGLWQIATTGGATRMVIDAAGNVGVGTATPIYPLDVNGPLRSLRNSSNDVVVQTTGGTNAWARFWMQTPNRSWALGTAQSFNEDQFYLLDATANQPRLTVQPNGGAIAFPLGAVGIGTSNPSARLTVSGVGAYNTSFAARFDLFNPTANTGFLQHVSDSGGWQIATTGGATRMTIDPTGNVGITGNATQDRSGGGWVKALVYLNGDGTLLRCYNGVTGVSIGNCGLISGRLSNPSSGTYLITFPFQINDRFYSVSVQDLSLSNPATASFENFGTSELVISVFDANNQRTDRPVMVVVY